MRAPIGETRASGRSDGHFSASGDLSIPVYTTLVGKQCTQRTGLVHLVQVIGDESTTLASEAFHHDKDFFRMFRTVDT